MAACVILFMVAAGGLYLFLFPGPQQICTFDSPDGRWRLIVLEQIPTPRPKESPYTYQLCLYDRASNKPLPGIVGRKENDSTCTPPTDFHVVWAANAVTVTCTNPISEHHCDFSKGMQSWR